MTDTTEEKKRLYVQKTRWLYFGVCVFSATIIIFFIWAIKINLQTYSWQKTQEQQIIEQAKTDINTYLKQEQQQLAATQKIDALEKSREILNQLLNKNTTTPLTDHLTATGTTVNQ